LSTCPRPTAVEQPRPWRPGCLRAATAGWCIACPWTRPQPCGQGHDHRDGQRRSVHGPVLTDHEGVRLEDRRVGPCRGHGRDRACAETPVRRPASGAPEAVASCPSLSRCVMRDLLRIREPQRPRRGKVLGRFSSQLDLAYTVSVRFVTSPVTCRPDAGRSSPEKALRACRWSPACRRRLERRTGYGKTAEVRPKVACRFSRFS
jgi:hypothetical protein